MRCGIRPSPHNLGILAGVLVFASCVSPAQHPPAELPAAYAQYRPPVACADSAHRASAPLPQNYDDVRRWTLLTRPDLFPRDGRVVTAFLWYFIREDGTVEETRLWRSSGSPAMDEVALEAGRQMRWRPALCAGQPVAMWYGHPVALG